jgi:hypothetical protein
MSDEPSERFLEQLRVVLIDVSNKQLDAMFRGVSNLSEMQTKALSRALNQANQTQSEAVVGALNSLVGRIFDLERAVAALSDGRAAEERGSLQ